MFATSALPASRFVAILAVVALIGVTLVGNPARGAAKSSSPAAVSAFSADDAIELITGSDGTLRFEISENATNFAWAGDPELKDGLPTERTAYFTQGYIYPAGTLTESNGVLADGSPEFPDKVLGQWSCWGWYQGSAAPDAMPRWVTHHLFSSGDEFGAATLVTEGYSIDDMNVPLARAVIGGSGPYAAAAGEQMETNLGFNVTNGLNVSYEIELTGN